MQTSLEPPIRTARCWKEFHFAQSPRILPLLGRAYPPGRRKRRRLVDSPVPPLHFALLAGRRRRRRLARKLFLCASEEQSGTKLDPEQTPPPSQEDPDLRPLPLRSTVPRLYFSHRPRYSRSCAPPTAVPQIFRTHKQLLKKTTTTPLRTLSLPSPAYLTPQLPQHLLPLRSTLHSHTLFPVATSSSPSSPQSIPTKSSGLDSSGKYKLVLWYPVAKGAYPLNVRKSGSSGHSSEEGGGTRGRKGWESGWEGERRGGRGGRGRGGRVEEGTVRSWSWSKVRASMTWTKERCCSASN